MGQREFSTIHTFIQYGGVLSSAFKGSVSLKRISVKSKSPSPDPEENDLTPASLPFSGLLSRESKEVPVEKSQSLGTKNIPLPERLNGQEKESSRMQGGGREKESNPENNKERERERLV